MNGNKPSSHSPASDTPHKRTHQPKIPLAIFAIRYALSDQVREKLAALGVQGPHALRFMTNIDLRGEGKLLIGEVGEVRDAEERWKDGEWDHFGWGDDDENTI
jgi:hypothetical protein